MPATPVPTHPPVGRPRTPPRRAATHGFTLVELMTAIAVLLILLLIVATVFGNAQRVVAVGTARAEVANYARALESNLRRDLVSVTTDAFLVIKAETKQIDAGATGTRRYAADQLLFFTTRSAESAQLVPMAGGATLSESGSANRIWYGHLVPPAWRIAMRAGVPLPPHQWSLGRQNLVLTAARPTGLPPRTSTDPAAPDPMWQFVVPSLWDMSPPYGPTLVPADPFPNPFPAGTLPEAPVPQNRPTSAVLASGTRDVAITDLLAIRRIVEAAPAAAADVPPEQAKARTMANACFRIQGAQYAPQVTAGDPPPPAMPATAAERLMQVHATLAPDCSSFRVEFAGDYDADGRLDRHPDGTVRWYGLGPDDAWPANNTTRREQSAAVKRQKRQTGVAEIDDRLATSGTPGPTGTVERWPVVFGYDRQATPWPWLFRVTAVLHDSTGRLHAEYERRPDAAVDGRTYSFVVPVGRGAGR